MKPLACFVLALCLTIFVTSVETDAQVPVFQGQVGSGPAWERFVEQLLERVRAEQIPEDDENRADDEETTDSPLLGPPNEPDSRVALARVVASMLQILAPEVLETWYGGVDRNLGLLYLVRELPAEINRRRGDTFEALAFQSLKATHSALVALVESDPDVKKTLERLADAVEHLMRARALASNPEDISFADAMLPRLAGVGGLIGREAIDHAEAAGVDKTVLTEAELALARSLEAAAEGRYGDVFDDLWITVEAGAIPILDLDQFARNIQLILQGKAVGYAFAIAANGVIVRAGDYGYARTVVDGLIVQSPFKEMNIASVSKTLTAMTLLQLLAEKGISVDDPVLPYLPASWQKGPGIAHLTFRALLEHRSGLDANRNRAYRYHNLRDYVAAGIYPADMVPHYQNTNYAMFRIIIPFLHYGPETLNYFELTSNFATVTAFLYREIVRERVLSKTGWVLGDCQPSTAPEVQTLHYRFPDNGGSGYRTGDWRSRCGSGGWYFSAVELAGILTTRRHTNSILSPATRQQMDLEFLGWAPFYGKIGVYRWHNGELEDHAVPPRGISTCWMDFPTGVQAALMINSLGAHDDPCNILGYSFDGAFVAPR